MFGPQAPLPPPGQAQPRDFAQHAQSQPLQFAPQVHDPSRPPPYVAPSVSPSHFAPPMKGAPPVATARSSMMAPGARLDLDADAIPMPMPAMPPAEPAAIMAASVFLGLPLAVATLLVAVLALR
jgi:hypothetical protein